MKMSKEKLDELSAYFFSREDVLSAFLFGSEAKGTAGLDSDIDIAVYFCPHSNRLDLEDDVVFNGEKNIWNSLEKITGKEVDLIVLNRASSTICASVYLEGIPIVIKDLFLYGQHFNITTDLAEEYRYFTEDYIAIKARSQSLNPIDRNRLLNIIDFLKTELEDTHIFENLSKKSYLEDPTMRRNVERWIENLVNASIDIAKIILASKGQPVPQTYREILLRLDTVDTIEDSTAIALSGFSRLRNILAYEYLDIRYPQIKEFIKGAPPEYEKLIELVSELIKNKKSD